MSKTNSDDVSLTNQVRAYHRSFYRPDNLALIVVGQVEADQLFEALSPLEEKIISKVSLSGSEFLHFTVKCPYYPPYLPLLLPFLSLPSPFLLPPFSPTLSIPSSLSSSRPPPPPQGSLPPMERPWQSPVPPLERSVYEKIQFPTDEEADGITRIAWRGPRAQVNVSPSFHVICYKLHELAKPEDSKWMTARHTVYKPHSQDLVFSPGMRLSSIMLAAGSTCVHGDGCTVELPN